jgi:hypothetical protein
MDEWWNDTDRVKPEYSEKYLSQFYSYFVRYRSHMDCPEIAPELPLYHYTVPQSIDISQ